MTSTPSLEPTRWSPKISREDKTSTDTTLVLNEATSLENGEPQPRHRSLPWIAGLDSVSALFLLPELPGPSPGTLFRMWICDCRRVLKGEPCPDCLDCRDYLDYSTERIRVSDKVEESTRQHQSPPALTPNERGQSTSVTWPSDDTRTGGIPCYEVPGFINDIPINGLPDSGSSVDGVSERFVERHGLKLETTRSQMIRLPGGGIAESVGQIVGYFKFQHEARVYRRDFHVLRNCVYDLVLGRKFLDMTETLTEFSQRIVKRVRPCVRRGNQLFLLDEAPKDRIRCVLNGVEAFAFPDTGSDLMLASGDFASRHNLEVHRGDKYRRPIELIDGTTIRTDGMVLNAELQFDVSTSASQVLDYDAYQTFVDTLDSLRSQGSYPQQRTSFICDLHIIEDLPCDIILSNEFIFQNEVFSRFKHLFYSKPTVPLPSDNLLEGGILFMRMSRGSRLSRWWSSRWRRQCDDTKKSAPSSDPVTAAGALSWEKRWEVEEARRNSAQLHIAVLPESQRSDAQRIEDFRRFLWDKENPRLLSGAYSDTSNTRIKRKEVPSST